MTHLPHFLENSPKSSEQFPKALQLIKYFPNVYKPVLVYTILHGVIQHYYYLRCSYFSLHTLYTLSAYLFNSSKLFKYFLNFYKLILEYITLHGVIRYCYLRRSYLISLHTLYTLPTHLFNFLKLLKYFLNPCKPVLEYTSLHGVIHYYYLRRSYFISLHTLYTLPAYLFNFLKLLKQSPNFYKPVFDYTILHGAIHYYYLLKPYTPTLEFDVRHCTVHTPYFILRRNYFIKSFYKKHALFTFLLYYYNTFRYSKTSPYHQPSPGPGIPRPWTPLNWTTTQTPTKPISQPICHSSKPANHSPSQQRLYARPSSSLPYSPANNSHIRKV